MDLSMVETQEARSKQTNIDLKEEHSFKHGTSKHGITRKDLREKVSKGM